MSENLFARRKIIRTIIRVNHAKNTHQKGVVTFIKNPSTSSRANSGREERAMTVLVEKVKEDHKKKLLPSHLNNNKVNKLNADINQVYDTIFSLGEILDVLKNTATEYVIRHFDTFVLAFHSFYK